MKRLLTDRNRLGVEKLESRDNPAGNITAMMDSSTFFLIGDVADNQLSVTENTAGELIVTGLNGTTINGQESVNFGVVTQNNLRLNLRDGNDSVDLSGVSTTGYIFLDMGAGNDSATLSNVSASGVGFSGGSGNDAVTLTAVSASIGVRIMGGDGVDTFTNNGTTTPNLYVDGLENPTTTQQRR